MKNLIDSSLVILDLSFKFLTIPQPQAYLTVTAGETLLNIESTFGISKSYMKKTGWIGINSHPKLGVSRVSYADRHIIREFGRRGIDSSFKLFMGGVIGAIKVVESSYVRANLHSLRVAETLLFDDPYPLNKVTYLWTLSEYARQTHQSNALSDYLDRQLPRKHRKELKKVLELA